MASANASGASCGRLWPTPPRIVRCEYGPENFARVGARFGMPRAVGVTLERDRGHGDLRSFGEPFLKVEVFGLAVGQP